MQLTIVTANVKNGLGDRAAARALRRAVDVMRADVVLLQEWGPGRADVLRDVLGAGRWRWTDTGRPIAWRRDVGQLIGHQVVELAPGRRVRKLPGRRRRLGPSWARVVTLLDDDGQHLTFANLHLPAAVERNGRARRGARGQQHVEAVDGLAQLYAAHAQHGPTFLGGDTNLDRRADLQHRHPRGMVRRLDRVGARSCWQGHLDDGRGTRDGGRRLIDDVWAGGRAARVDLVDVPGDHLAVVVEYDLGQL